MPYALILAYVAAAIGALLALQHTPYLFLVYGVLATLALVALWHDRRMRPLGWALVGAWAASIVIAFGLNFDWRPVLFPLIDVMVAAIARKIFVRTGHKIAVAVTIASLCNCMVNFAYAWILVTGKHDPTADLDHLHTLATNIVSGAKCLLVTGWGIVDAYGWPGLFSRFGLRDRALAEPDGGGAVL